MFDKDSNEYLFENLQKMHDVKKQSFNKAKILKESEESPKLANFWYINGDFYGPTCDVREGEIFDKYVTCGINHFDSWKDYGEEHSNKYTYEHFPRGRVGYNIMTRSFYVIGNEDMIKDNSFKCAIKNKYNLPEDTTFISDIHYDLP